MFFWWQMQVVKEGLLNQNNSKLDEWSCFADDFMHFISKEKSKSESPQNSHVLAFYVGFYLNISNVNSIFARLLKH